jgi:hypothetical protein
MQTVFNDVGYALRQLGKAPGLPWLWPPTRSGNRPNAAIFSAVYSLPLRLCRFRVQIALLGISRQSADSGGTEATFLITRIGGCSEKPNRLRLI